MKQFSLEKWLQDKSRKVVTRDGRPARIICWDKLGDYPIIACIKYSENYEDFETYTIKGLKYSFDCEDKNDLFFADEEKETIEIPFGVKDSEFIKDEYFIPEGCKARIEGNKVIIERIQREEELTEFEKALLAAFNCVAGKAVMTIGPASFQEDVDEWSKTLLDLARKELKPEFDKEMDNLLAETDKVVYQKGQQDALKDLPKWEKNKLPNSESYMGFTGSYFCYRGYNINYDKLFEKLPKEE